MTILALTPFDVPNNFTVMKFEKKGLFAEVSRKSLEQVVAEVRPDDGVDPRELAKQRRRERRTERIGQGHGVHKQEQFLSQVQTAIESALQTAAEPILNSLTVQEVVVQGGSLVVIVTPQDATEAFDLEGATCALKQAAAQLRREVAITITRKETPNLKFVVLPSGSEKVSD